MSLNQKFKESLSGLTMSVSALRLDERCRVMQAKRIETRHGTRVVLILLEEDDRVISVFLPKRYGDAMEDSDMQDINTRRLLYYLNYRGKSSLSSALWFSEFQPVNFTGLPFIVALLKAFFDENICCHVGGDFPTYIAGVQISFEGVNIFFALKDNPLLKLIFQIGENPPAIFHVGPFEFALLQNVGTGDVCQYHIRLGDDTMIVTCIGIESASCGVYCNVDFFHFVWENSNVFCFRRRALTFLPTPGNSKSRLLCLRHYRVASEGWTFTSRCGPCSAAFQEECRHLVGCGT
jgi:hypothetical protein